MNVFDLYAKINLDSSGYEKGLSVAKSLAETVGGGIAGIFSKAASLTVDALSAAGSALKSFTADAVQTGMDFDKSMSQVAATMGTTTDQIQNLRDFAREMGSQTQYSATEAAQALNYMALAGYDAETSMAMLPNVLNLAAAGNFELARASDMVTDTQTAFGISIERTTQLVDEMAKASSTGNTSVELLGEAFLTVGGLAKELNGGLVILADGTQAEVDGVQELEIALTAMANAGIKGSEAGTHMRNMLLKLADSGEAGEKAFEELGMSIYDDSGKMKSLKEIFGDMNTALSKLTQEEKLKKISAIFNTRDTASAEALLSAVAQDWDNIGAAILDASGAAQQMAETQLDNLAGDTKTLQSAMDDLKISVSDALSPALRDLAQTGTTVFRDLNDAYKANGLKGLFTMAKLEIQGFKMDFQRGFEDFFPKMLEYGGEFVTYLAKGVAGSWDTILGMGLQVVNGLTEGLLSQDSIDQFLETAPKVIQNFADSITSYLIGEGKDGEGGLVGAVNLIMQKLTDYTTNEENRAKLYESAKNILKTLGQFLVDNTKVLVPFAFEVVGALASMIWEMLSDALMNLINSDYHLGAVGQYGNAIKEAYLSANTDLSFEDWIYAGMPGLDTDAYTSSLYTNDDSYYTMTGMSNDDGTQNGDNIPAAGWNEWQKYNEYRISDAAMQGKSSSFSISIGDIHVSGTQDTGEEVVRQIDRALRELQIRQQRGIGGTAWQL